MYLRAYVDWQKCMACGKDSGTGFVRMYQLDGTETIGSHGEPNTNWIWSCGATRLGETVIIQLAKDRPPRGGLEEVERLAEKEGFLFWGWERTDKRGERVRLFPVRRRA